MRGGLGGAQANATGLNDGQSAGQPGQNGCLLSEARNEAKNEIGIGIAGQFEHYEAVILFWRVVAYVSKTKITSEQAGLVFLRVTGNHGVFGMAETNVPNVNRLVSVCLQ